MRKDRTILLTTHFLEEADALSDNIIILSNGQIIENDTSNQLKMKYGTGYKLILNKNPDYEHFDPFQFIEKTFPNAKIETETNNQLIIQTNEQSSKSFIQLFHYLDQFKLNQQILNYSLSNTTLG